MAEKKVLQFIKENGLIKPKDTVIAAVSGGADSVCLLDMLCLLSKELDITVAAAHLNHNLRGEESDGDEAYVRRLCESRGITLHTRSVDVLSMASGQSLEDAARKARYDFFDALSESDDTYVATAHSMDDNAETFFINLLRGSGSRGLGGIPVKRGRIIRPLLCMTRSEIEAHLEMRGIPYRTDSTNSDTVFLRNFIRHEVIPVFKKRADTDIIKSISRVTENLRRENEALQNIALANDTNDAGALLALDDAVLYRVLNTRLEKEFGLILDSLHFDAVKSLLSRQNSRELIRDGIYAENRYGKIYFVRADDTERKDKVLCDGETEYYGKRILIKNVKEIYKGLTNNVIDCDKISNVLHASTRRDGDIFLCKGRNCTSKLKKLLINDRVPKAVRDSMVVIRNDVGDIVFAEGFGADKRFAADEKSENMISIEII